MVSEMPMLHSKGLDDGPSPSNAAIGVPIYEREQSNGNKTQVDVLFVNQAIDNLDRSSDSLQHPRCMDTIDLDSTALVTSYQPEKDYLNSYGQDLHNDPCTIISPSWIPPPDLNLETVWSCISLIHSSSDDLNLHLYCCQRLYEFPLSEIEFYLPQLCILLIYQPYRSPMLESFVLNQCAKSIHIALKCQFFLSAIVQPDHPYLIERIENLKYACQLAVIDGKIPILGENANPITTPREEVTQFSKEKAMNTIQLHPNEEKASQVHANNQSAPSFDEFQTKLEPHGNDHYVDPYHSHSPQVDHQFFGEPQLIHTSSQCLSLNLQAHPNKDIESNYHSTTTLLEDGPSSSNLNGINQGGKHFGGNDHSSPDVQLHLECEDDSTKFIAKQHHLNTEQQSLYTDENSDPDLQSAFSIDHLRCFYESFDSPRDLRYKYFSSIKRFIKELVEIGQKLCHAPECERSRAVCSRLKDLNDKLSLCLTPQNASFMPGLYLPCSRSDQPHYSIVRIPQHEAILLNSRMRAPFMVAFEAVTLEDYTSNCPQDPAPGNDIKDNYGHDSNLFHRPSIQLSKLGYHCSSPEIHTTKMFNLVNQFEFLQPCPRKRLSKRNPKMIQCGDRLLESRSLTYLPYLFPKPSPYMLSTEKRIQERQKKQLFIQKQSQREQDDSSMTSAESLSSNSQISVITTNIDLVASGYEKSNDQLSPIKSQISKSLSPDENKGELDYLTKCLNEPSQSTLESNHQCNLSQTESTDSDSTKSLAPSKTFGLHTHPHSNSLQHNHDHHSHSVNLAMQSSYQPDPDSRSNPSLLESESGSTIDCNLSDHSNSTSSMSGFLPNSTTAITSDTFHLRRRELWVSKENRVRTHSPFGSLSGWCLRGVIVKYGQDGLQEQLVLQLLMLCARIWRASGLPLHLVPYEVLVLDASDAYFIEPLVDAISVHQLKKYNDNITLNEYFVRKWQGTDSPAFQQAQRNFLRSLAAYSLVCYVLQLKDRHNANILIDDDAGYIIHVDWGYVLSTSPGSIGFETAPFKLTQEYVELLGGIRSRQFTEFRQLFIDGFFALRAQASQILQMVSIMFLCGTVESLPCRIGGKATLQALEQRLRNQVDDETCRIQIEQLIDSSYNNWRTRQYDNYQWYSNGIYY